MLLQGATGLNTGDIIATSIVLLIGLGIVSLILFFAFSKRPSSNKNEQVLILQKRVDDLQVRVTKMEKLLKDDE